MIRRLLPLAAAAMLVSCTPLSDPPPAETPAPGGLPSPTAEAPATEVPTAESPAEGPADADQAVDLQPIVDDVVAAYGGTAGLAVSDGRTDVAAGDDAPYPAWSTIKVPISVAALRRDPAAADTVAAAIRSSDNAAAEALWAALPPGAADAVLAEGGVPITINTEVLRPEFSTFGQTGWSPSQQARFAAHLPCLAGAGEVVAAMGEVTPAHAYGVGQLPEARFKGGWGPDEQGKYTVRQFGLVAGPNGDVAVALTAAPASGVYADAQAMATQLAHGLAGRLASLPTVACR